MQQKHWKEFLFQAVLTLIVFLLYAWNPREATIEPHNYLFFANYAIAALIIGFVFLPKLLYTKKYILFALAVLIIICLVIIIEETVLEVIYFPDTRGTNFPGIIYSLTDVLPLITILTGFKFAWDAFYKQQQVENLEEAVQESELQFLKSQINPHFLFNNLNNLYSYAMENSPKTPTIILELSSVLRYMLYECKERYVPLEKEIDQLESFTKLNQLQIEDRGDIAFHKKNISHGHMIAPLILIVFIENAFKHSQSSQADNIGIDISTELRDNTLHFACKNTFSATSNTDRLSKGIGLANVRKRLQLIYPDAHELRITEMNDEYFVQLSVQLDEAA